jgi:hypothetical protein
MTEPSSTLSAANSVVAPFRTIVVRLTRRADVELRRHAADAPVRGMTRLGVDRGMHDRIDGLLRDRCPGTRGGRRATTSWGPKSSASSRKAGAIFAQQARPLLPRTTR